MAHARIHDSYRSLAPRAQHSGAALIEFILLLGLLLLLVSAISDLAVLMRKSYTLSEAARHGARSAAALWRGASGCPTAGPVSQTCDSVSSLPDPLVKSVGEATCTYIDLAGFSLADWTFSFTTLNNSWSGENGTNGSPALTGRVTLSQGSAKQCVFCWQAFIGDLLMNSNSEFVLENNNCLAITP